MTETLKIEVEIDDPGAKGFRRMAEDSDLELEELAEGILVLAGLEYLENNEFQKLMNGRATPKMISQVF